MDRFFGCYKLASEMRQKIIKETRLPISFAMSSNVANSTELNRLIFSGLIPVVH
jgi:hypothetical protein